MNHPAFLTIGVRGNFGIISGIEAVRVILGMMLHPYRGSVRFGLAVLGILHVISVHAQTAQTRAPVPWIGGDDKAIQALITQGNQLGLNLQDKLSRITEAMLGAECPPGEERGDKTAPPGVEGIAFIEQVYAMVLAQDWPDFLERHRQIRARTAENFQPELFSEWLPANRWLFWDVTSELEITPISLEWPVRGKHPAGGPEDESAAAIGREASMTLIVIPRENIANLAGRLATGDLLVGIQRLPTGLRCQTGIGISTFQGTIVRYADERIGQVTECIVTDWLSVKESVGLHVSRLHARAEMLARPIQFDLTLPQTKQK